MDAFLSPSGLTSSCLSTSLSAPRAVEVDGVCLRRKGLSSKGNDGMRIKWIGLISLCLSRFV